MKFQSNSIFNGKITANSVADAGTNTDKFLVLSSNGDVSYRTAAELYIDLGIGSLPAGYTSTLKHQVKAGVALTKGQAVYVTSADGTNMIVGKASNGAESTSSKTLGLIETSLSNNGIGNVITEGLLAGLDTTGANAAGDPVWLGTNGNLIYGLLNKPSAPAHLVFIGVVTRVNANNGEIFVKVQNGFELGELHNYAESGVQNNDIITWESSTSLYKPKSIATILGYTPVPTTRTLTINGTAYDLSADRSWTISANINARTEYEFTTNGSSATYSATYTVGQVDVFYNGSKLASTEFTATNGTSVILGFTPPSGQIVEVVAWETGGGVSNGRTLTINGVSYDLSADRSWTISTGVSGSGTTNYIPKWSSSTGLGNSTIYDNGSAIGINTTSPLANLHVYNGSAAASILLQTNSSTDYAEIAVRNAAAVATSYFRQYSASASGTLFGVNAANLAGFFSNYASNFAIGTLNGGSLIFATDNIERFRIATSTGAATFTGALNGTSAIFSGTINANSANSQIKIGGATTDAFIGVSTSTLYLTDWATAAKGLTINLSTGAATFSSSVTAANYIGEAATTELRLKGGGYGASYNTSLRSITGAIGVLQFGNNNDNYILAGNTAAGGYLIFKVNCTSESTASGIEAMRISSSGNVGIGTSTFNGNNLLQVAGRVDVNLDQGAFRLFNGSNTFIGGIGTGAWVDGTSTTDIGIYSINTLRFYSGGSSTAKMTITSGGDLRFGNTGQNGQFIYGNSNEGYLSISGGEAAGTTYGANITLVSNSRGGLNLRGELSLSAGNTGGTGSYINFLTNGTERMRLTSGGKLLVNTSSVISANYTIQATSGSGGGFVTNAAGAGDASFYSTTASIGWHFYAETTSTKFYVLNNGDVRNANNSYGAISDISLKENIVDATPKLADLMKVKVRNYNFIADENKEKQLGVIAQELEEIFPNMISEDKQMGKEETIKTVKYSVFVPMLIKAIQEQQQQIEELKARLN